MTECKRYSVEYFVIGNGEQENTIEIIDTSKALFSDQMGEILAELKKRLRQDKLKLDDIIIFKITRIEV